MVCVSGRPRRAAGWCVIGRGGLGKGYVGAAALLTTRVAAANLLAVDVGARAALVGSLSIA